MKRVTLSFDNGPEPEVTPAVLDLLRRHGFSAHFFVLGKLIATGAGRALAERACTEGHLLGNHSYTHEVPLGLDARADAVEREIVATEDLLAPLGSPTRERRFRPFGGGGLIGKHLLSRRAADHLIEHRYSCVLWSSVPRDWEDQRGWPERALADIETREHSVVVLHDILNGCLEGLPQFLDALRQRSIAVTLELPEDCVPIAQGRVVRNLEDLVAEGDRS